MAFAKPVDSGASAAPTDICAKPLVGSILKIRKPHERTSGELSKKVSFGGLKSQAVVRAPIWLYMVKIQVFFSTPVARKALVIIQLGTGVHHLNNLEPSR